MRSRRVISKTNRRGDTKLKSSEEGVRRVLDESGVGKGEVKRREMGGGVR